MAIGVNSEATDTKSIESQSIDILCSKEFQVTNYNGNSINVRLCKWSWNNTDFKGDYSSAEVDCPLNGTLASTKVSEWSTVKMKNCNIERFFLFK